MDLEPVKGSENKAFKKQKVVTQMIRKKGFKKKEMVSSIEDSRGVSEVSSGLCNYQTVKLAKAVSVEWGKKKSGFTCRVKSKIERNARFSPLSLQICALTLTILLSVLNIRHHQHFYDSIEFG